MLYPGISIIKYYDHEFFEIARCPPRTFKFGHDKSPHVNIAVLNAKRGPFVPECELESDKILKILGAFRFFGCLDDKINTGF